MRWLAVSLLLVGVVGCGPQRMKMSVECPDGTKKELTTFGIVPSQDSNMAEFYHCPSETP